ncbi:MAG: hypothetical protein WC641_05400 [Patescibacteria group bacterium]
MLHPDLDDLKRHIAVFEQIASVLTEMGCGLEPTSSENDHDIYLVGMFEECLELALVLRLPRLELKEADSGPGFEEINNPTSVFFNLCFMEFVDCRYTLEFTTNDGREKWTVDCSAGSPPRTRERQLDSERVMDAICEIARLFLEIKNERDLKRAESVALTGSFPV